MARFIVRILLELLSLPGVLVHEFGHQAACWVTGTRVLKVCYFRFRLPPGYVLHEVPASVWRHLVIATGPMFVNTGLGYLLGWAACQGMTWAGSVLRTRILLTWLAISVAMHAFPSLQDANNVMEDIWRPGGGWLTRLVATPLGALLYLGAFASWIWLDVAWGVALGGWLPSRWGG